MSVENSLLVRRLFDEVWNGRNEAMIEELLDEDSVCYADDGPMRGPTEFRKRQFEPFLAAFPDLHVEVEDVLWQGDQVVVRWCATGSHKGEGLGFPPTERPASFRGVSWIRVRDGKLGEGWQFSNIPVVLRSLAAPAE
jgi:steroid delta-isomerase-like uncharacterized protein